MNAADYAGPLLVTVAYVLVYYSTMIQILRVKVRLTAAYRARNEKFDRYFGQDREMLAADRAQLNMLEHMPPFLALLWLNAVFVGATWATGIGAVYVLSRLAYPLMLGSKVGGQPRAQIMVATLPGYLVMLAFSVALLFVAVPALLG